jgi:hypothetical protein
VSYLSEAVRGVVYHVGVRGAKILFIDDKCAQTAEIKKDTVFDLTAGSYRIHLRPDLHRKLRNSCLRDTLVYETDKNGPRQYTEHDFPLTPEQLVGRIERVIRSSPDPAERACPRNPDTSGRGT